MWERVRWKETGASPFGIAFRFVEGAEKAAPVETWPYRAPFLPAGASIPIVTPAYASQEPLVFLSLVAQAPAEWPVDSRPSLELRGGRHTLTGIKVSRSRETPPSKQFLWFCEQGLIRVAAGNEDHAELEWDNGQTGGGHDFRPDLPLSFRW